MLYLKEAYNNSYTAKFLFKSVIWLKKILAHSKFWCFISKESRISVLLRQSYFFRCIEWIVTAPSYALRGVYEKHRDLFAYTILITFVDYLISRYYVIMGFCFFLIAVVPDRFWNNIYNTYAVLILALLFFAKTIVRKDERFEVLRMDFALIIFIITVVLAEATSIVPGSGARFLVFYFTCFLLVLLLVSSIKYKSELGLIMEILLAGITLTALYGIYQSIQGVPVDPTLTDVSLNRNSIGRVYSSFGNPNNYAQLLILFLPYYAAVIFNSRSMIKRLVFAVLAVPPLLVLFMTGSRSGWIAFAVLVFVYVFLKNRKMIPFVILSFIVLIPFLPQSIYRRLLTLQHLINDSSASYRMAIYVNVLAILKDFWFTGVGLGPVPFAKIYHRYFLGASIVAHSHNLYLEQCIELGITGLVSFLWFSARLVKNSVKNIFNKADGYLNNVLTAGTASLMGILTIGMVEHVWFYPRVMFFFWLNVGIILTCLGIMKHERNSGVA